VAGVRGIKPTIPVAQMTRCAKTILREFGIIRRRRGSVCGITDSLTRLLARKPNIRWKRLFGASYGRAERQIVACCGYASTSATEWVNAIDVFNDMLFDAVFRKDGALGVWPAGNLGAALNSPSSRFAQRYPRCCAYASETHDKRLQSWLSHATVRKTGHDTGPLPFRYIKRSVGLLNVAVVEIEGAALV
jgi:hypothetical protein